MKNQINRIVMITDMMPEIIEIKAYIVFITVNVTAGTAFLLPLNLRAKLFQCISFRSMGGVDV
jgi:hypothetical protein